MTDIADEIEDMVRLRPYTSFAEISRRWPRQEGEETCAFCLPSDDNLVMWAGLPSAVADAIQQLIKDGRVHLHPCSSMLVYAADGMFLKLPIIKRLPRGPLKKPHWVPVVLQLGRACSDKDCPNRPDPKPTKRPSSARRRTSVRA